MAAPSYLIKLKFGTEIDKKAFNQLQAEYEKMGKKQRQIFAKNYNSSVEDMNKLFKKETTLSLRDYERAAIKTEQTITKSRVTELRKYVEQRKQFARRMGMYAGGALLTGAVGIGNIVVGSSSSLTQFEKNTISKTLNMGSAGIATGAAVGSVLPVVGTAIGAGVGAVVGTSLGYVMSEFENSADKIQRSATLFNTAVSTYRSTLDFTKGMTTGMAGAGFTDPGQYAIYKRALASVGIENDTFMNDLFRSLAAQSGTEQLGMRLINTRRDVALDELYKRFQASGMTAREFVMSSTAKGGLNQSDFRADALISLFEAGGLRNVIQETLQYAGVAVGENASSLTPTLRANEKKRRDLENREWAQRLKNVQTLESIDMNEAIMTQNAREFSRSVQLMKENELLLEGVNELYRSYSKELSQIFAEITRKTGKGTTYAEGAAAALKSGGVNAFTSYVKHQGLPYSPVQPLMSRVDDAKDRINQTRAQNSPIPIGAM